MPILDLAYKSDRCGPPDHRRLFLVAPRLPAELEDADVTLVRGEPYRTACANTLWMRGLRFDIIRDGNPDKTLENCLLVAREFPRLLVAGSGVLELQALPEAWIPHILMAFHEDVRNCARHRASSVVLDLGRAKTAWLDAIGRDALLPDPMARRALVAWLVDAMTKNAEEAIVVVDLAHREDLRHFSLCARTVLPRARVLLLDALPHPNTPVNVLRIGSDASRWNLEARRSMHYDGVLISDENCTDMPSIKVTDVCIATQDLALLRKIVEVFPKEILHS
jgi:hypothetical protein